MIDKLRSEIAAIEAKIVMLQQQCNHPPMAVTETPAKEHTASGMIYWTDCKCVICGREWERQ